MTQPPPPNVQPPRSGARGRSAGCPLPTRDGRWPCSGPDMAVVTVVAAGLLLTAATPIALLLTAAWALLCLVPLAVLLPAPRREQNSVSVSRPVLLRPGSWPRRSATAEPQIARPHSGPAPPALGPQ